MRCWGKFLAAHQATENTQFGVTPRQKPSRYTVEKSASADFAIDLPPPCARIHSQQIRPTDTRLRCLVMCKSLLSTRNCLEPLNDVFFLILGEDGINVWGKFLAHTAIENTQLGVAP